MNSIEKFELTDDDYWAIEITKKIVRRFLQLPQITPQQIIGLGNALYALERLPLATPGCITEFGIVYRAGTEKFSEMRFINFNITSDIFEVSQGGSVYDEAVGGDTLPSTSWYIEVGGIRAVDWDLYEIEDLIEEYINLGAKISVLDESDIEYEFKDDK